MSRCLYNSSFDEFISADENLIFGVIDGGAHGVTLTTAKEAPPFYKGQRMLSAFS